ncbi:YcaO-like family protein [Sorangium sp. So ce367]|uniref:YcaO-like family protein n=1 Tax=Sorangium sp. So ce367 TaxID=3133305 RepID=UPI003F61AE3D
MYAEISALISSLESLAIVSRTVGSRSASFVTALGNMPALYRVSKLLIRGPDSKSTLCQRSYLGTLQAVKQKKPRVAVSVGCIIDGKPPPCRRHSSTDHGGRTALQTRDPWRFPPSPKIDPLVDRVTTADDAERRVSAIATRVPITRVSDLSPLDRLRLPVFAAVTPLARDLTTHLGKGRDATSARVSALMEAVERVSAESIPESLTLRASFRDLEGSLSPPALDPALFDLPDDTLYSAERAITWVAGRELRSETGVLLAADLAVSPPTDGLLRDVDTNGLASGSTVIEAVIHALCEVIERDAQAQVEFFALFGAPEAPPPPLAQIDPTTLPDSARGWLDALAAHDLHMVVHDITNDIGVATFWAVLTDSRFPTADGVATRTFSGAGTAPRAEVALLRAITEAVQSRVGVIHGARDAWNFLPAGRRAESRTIRLRQLLSMKWRPFSAVPSFASTDLRDDLAFLLSRLADAGIERVIAVDLTRPDIGIPVVRVRVPGLSPFLVNRRRVGERCLRHLLWP